MIPNKLIISLLFTLFAVNNNLCSQSQSESGDKTKIISDLKEVVVLTYELSKRRNRRINREGKFKVRKPQLIHTEHIPGVGEIAILLDGSRRGDAKCYLVCGKGFTGQITEFYIEGFKNKKWDLVIHVDIDLTQRGICSDSSDYDSCAEINLTKTKKFDRIIYGTRMDVNFNYKSDSKELVDDKGDPDNICRVIAL